jgi:hypothetical protein
MKSRALNFLLLFTAVRTRSLYEPGTSLVFESSYRARVRHFRVGNYLWVVAVLFR